MSQTASMSDNTFCDSDDDKSLCMDTFVCFLTTKTTMEGLFCRSYTRHQPVTASMSDNSFCDSDDDKSLCMDTFMCFLTTKKTMEGLFCCSYMRHQPVNRRQMTRARTLEKTMMEVIRVTRTVLGSETQTGKYIFCLYSFSCDFLYNFMCDHSWSLHGYALRMCCIEEVQQIKEKRV